MIEVNVNNITKYYGASLIFENVSFSIHTGERIGLIGPNGCGKTTLLKIIIGQENIQQGDITFKKGAKVGYLDQIPSFEDDVTVEAILQSAKEDVYHLKQKMDALAISFGQLDGEKLQNALDEYSHLTHSFEQLNGYLVETDINTVASGLKLTDEMRQLPFSVLSGGEKTRVMLARILLEHPTVLLLDEPSNHLDLESIEWLEGYLSTYDGSVLIVSHDRYFLDNVCQKIVELSTHRAITYHGNYSYYVIERERRFLLELKVYLAQEKQIKRMEEQIKRYRIWGEMRDSDKMFKRAKELERRLDKIERLDKPIKDPKKIKLKHSISGRSGKRVLEALSIYKSFDDVLLEDASLELIFQDRLAILGPNGCGKTTLLKLLLDDYQQSEDHSFKWGSNINLGYLPQEVIFEDESLTVLEYFMKKHNLNQNDARQELAKALFIRDDVFKKIQTLSGGEKSKLILRSLTYNHANFMILDEPTNHLDIDSREVLEDMLLEFDGTIMFVSHDRYFIKKIANRIGEIRDKQIIYYEGDYDYYKVIQQRERNNDIVSPPKSTTKQQQKQTKKVDPYPLIQTLEHRLEELHLEMEEHAYDHQKLMELYVEKDQIDEELLQLYNAIENE